MSASRRQQHPADGAAGGAVRPDDADPGRAARPSGTGSSWSASCRPGDPLEAKLELARFIVGRSHGRGGGARPRRTTSRASSARGRRPRRCRRTPLPEGDPLHLPALLVERLGLGSTSEARRLIAQGARQGGRRGRDATLDLPRERLAGALVQAGKRRFVRFALGLTRLRPRFAAIIPEPLGRAACRTVPVPRPGAPSDADGYDGCPQHWRPLARVGGFFTRRPTSATVFENSAVRITPRPRRLARGGLESPSPSEPLRAERLSNLVTPLRRTRQL